jgi:small neutral amino acid transporter SnatA (MarC family)
VLPSRLRRLTVILVYLLAIFLAANAAVVLVATPGCLSEGSCRPGTRVLIQIVGLAWLALSATTIIAGWKGLLLGARRRRRVEPDVVLA